MRVVSELRRRNVLRMAALYVVAAWLVMQAAEIVVGLVDLPGWIGPTTLIVLAVGFPIALIFSWFFELTPEGLSLEKDVPAGHSITHVTGRRMDFILIAILSAGLILFACDKWWPRESLELSIAVLPFDNMSADPGQEFFSDGISEEILNLLAQIDSLKVIARHSSFSFKGKDIDIATMAEQMGVRHILEGSVRRSGDRVRITAQLIDAKDSSQLWSEAYDRDYSAENLIEIQSEIARAITGRLRMTLTGEDEERLAKVPTENTEAYAAYLLGRQRLTDRRVDWLEDAVDQFAHAVELDADFAGAYSGLFDACNLYKSHSGGHQHERCPAGPEALLQLAQKAVKLDEDLGEAWISLASALEGEANSLPEESPRSEKIAKLKAAQAAYERGLSLNPSHIQGYHWYALFLSSIGLYDGWKSWLEAWKVDTWQSVIKRGLEMDPLSITLHHRLSEYPMWASTEEKALHHARRIIEIAPDSPRGYARLSELSWWTSGRIDESIRWANKAVEIDPRQPTYAMQIALGYATLGDIDMAMAYWEHADQIIADDVTPEKFHVLRALILLSDKDSVLMQQSLDALEPIDVGSTNRMEIEAYLAIINGEAKKWLESHAGYLSDCLNAPIDQAYLNKWPECAGWLDGLLLAAGEEARARSLAKKRIPWFKKWVEWGGKQVSGDPRGFVMLGKEDEALDAIEKYLAFYRGNPYTFRLYLAESLRFILYHDPLLGPIRDHSRFQAIVSEVEADLAQQLENVREMERRSEVPTLEELNALIASTRESG